MVIFRPLLSPEPKQARYNQSRPWMCLVFLHILHHPIWQRTNIPFAVSEWGPWGLKQSSTDSEACHVPALPFPKGEWARRCWELWWGLFPHLHAWRQARSWQGVKTAGCGDGVLVLLWLVTWAREAQTHGLGSKRMEVWSCPSHASDVCAAVRSPAGCFGAGAVWEGGNIPSPSSSALFHHPQRDLCSSWIELLQWLQMYLRSLFSPPRPLFAGSFCHQCCWMWESVAAIKPRDGSTQDKNQRGRMCPLSLNPCVAYKSK